MKKLAALLALSLIILSSTDINAQMATKGIKGGGNASSLYVDGSADYGFLFDFHAGVFFRTAPIERFSLQLELLYSRQGASLEVEQSFSSYSGEQIRLNYISLPVMARINFLNNKAGLLIGPSINYLAGVGDDGDIEGSGEDLRGLYNDFDFTLNLGWEYDVSSGVLVGARGSIGLSDIMSGDNVIVESPAAPNPIPYLTDNRGITNVVLQIYVGLIF